MAQTKIFRDRVVSLEQTQEIGEKHLDLLTDLVREALPELELVDHGLEHEADLFWLSFRHATTGQPKRVSFTRMVLSDSGRLPAVVDEPNGPVRARIVELIRAQATRPEIAVTLRQLLTDEERVEADEIDAEWRKKQEALLAAKRAEEERRAREKKRLRQIEEQRRAEKRKRERQAAGGAPQQGRGGDRRNAPAPQGAHAQKGGGGPQGGRGEQPRGPRPPQPPRPQNAPKPAPAPGVAAGADAQAAGGEKTGGGRRRRRRHRGGRGGASPQPGAAAHGGGASGQG